MPRSKKIVYHCDCQQFCKGELRELGRKVYFAHATHRKRNTQSNASLSSGGPWSGTTEVPRDPPSGPQSGHVHHSSGESPSPSGLPAQGDTLEGGHVPLSGDDGLSCRADDLGNMQPAVPDMLHLPTPPESPHSSINNLEFL